jgi:hypothetical protein
MLRSPVPATREAALRAISQRCERYRSAPARLVPPAAPALDDPEPSVRAAALRLLRRAGRAAAPYADALAALAAEHLDAVHTLMLLGDPRWVAHDPGDAFDIFLVPPVVAAARARLAADPGDADYLAQLLAAWGATEAIPEIVAAVPRAALPAALALLRLGHDEPAAEPLLRAFATRHGHLSAAMSVWRLTGDPSVIVAALRTRLAGYGWPGWPGIAALAEVAGALPPLLPEARSLLIGAAARSHSERERQLEAALIVAAAGDPDAARPTVLALVRRGGTLARTAADFLVEVGVPPEAVPLLRERLTDPWCRVAAARALVAAGVPVAEVTGPLVAGLAGYAGGCGLPAIRELRAVDAVPALRALAASDDRRPWTSLLDGDVVWADERLQDAIRSAIAELSA